MFNLSCSRELITQSNCVGAYFGESPSAIRLYYDWYIKNTHYGVGQELILKEDSTYRIHYCNSFANGRWALVNDSLILLPSTQTEMNDTAKINHLAKRKSYYVYSNGVLVETINIDKKTSHTGKEYVVKCLLYKK